MIDFGPIKRSSCDAMALDGAKLLHCGRTTIASGIFIESRDSLDQTRHQTPCWEGQSQGSWAQVIFPLHPNCNFIKNILDRFPFKREVFFLDNPIDQIQNLL